MKILKIILVVVTLSSCGMSASYSPLDNYISATIHSDSANARSAQDAKHFIDSINTKIK